MVSAVTCARGAQLKITPANQTLILAGEPGGTGSAANSLLGRGLKRLTILAANPQATVVVQADYFPPGDSVPPPYAHRPGDSTPPPYAHRLEYDSQHATLSRPAPISSYMNPIQLYTRTQRGLDDKPRAALLDVHA